MRALPTSADEPLISGEREVPLVPLSGLPRAAQAGFIGGPQLMSNMAVDSWFPHRFASLSDRLTMQNGVLLMSAAALVTLLTGVLPGEFLREILAAFPPAAL